MNNNIFYKKYEIKINNLHTELEKNKVELNAHQELISSYKEELTKKINSMKILKTALTEAEKEILTLEKENKKINKKVSESDSSITLLKTKNKNLSNKTKQISEMNKEQEKLQKQFQVSNERKKKQKNY